jgi:hypothetical protein
MRTFWWESLCGWDFSRPQLVVVSGLFGGNPSMDGIFLGHNLLLSQAFSVGIPRWMGFRLSGSLSHELFSFFLRWNFGYQGALLTNFFLFSRWNFGYQEAFLTNFFLFHDGISAIRKPFSRTFFFFFLRWNFGYQEAFLTNFFLFSR